MGLNIRASLLAGFYLITIKLFLIAEVEAAIGNDRVRPDLLGAAVGRPEALCAAVRLKE